MNAALDGIMDAGPPVRRVKLQDGSEGTFGWAYFERDGNVGVRCVLSIADGSRANELIRDLSLKIFPQDAAGINEKMISVEKSLVHAANDKLRQGPREGLTDFYFGKGQKRFKP